MQLCYNINFEPGSSIFLRLIAVLLAQRFLDNYSDFFFNSLQLNKYLLTKTNNIDFKQRNVVFVCNIKFCIHNGLFINLNFQS